MQCLDMFSLLVYQFHSETARFALQISSGRNIWYLLLFLLLLLLLLFTYAESNRGCNMNSGINVFFVRSFASVGSSKSEPSLKIMKEIKSDLFITLF